MKTGKAITTLAALTATFVCSSAIAESRIWTDTAGKTIEAEQVKLLNDQVLLRLADGREIKVSLDALSPEDRKSAMLSEPPKLEVKVSAKTSRSNSTLRDAGRGSRVQVEEESTQVMLAVSKISSTPYELPLNAVLYVMGERDGENHEIIDKVAATFTYTEHGQVFELVSDPFESAKRQGGERRTEYAGWLVVVFDSNGESVAVKGSKPEYENNVDPLLASEKGAALSSGYETVKTSDSDKLGRHTRF